MSHKREYVPGYQRPSIASAARNSINTEYTRRRGFPSHKPSNTYGDITVEESVWKKYGDEKPTTNDGSTREWLSTQSRERNDQQHKFDDDAKAPSYGMFNSAADGKSAGLDKDYLARQKAAAGLDNDYLSRQKAAAGLDTDYLASRQVTYKDSPVDKVGAADGQDQRLPDKDKTRPDDKVKVADRPDERQEPMKGKAGPVGKAAASKDKWNGARPKEKDAKFKPEMDRDEAPYAKYDHRPRGCKRDNTNEEACLNLEFYKNELKSKPGGCHIEEMLGWRGHYHKLEHDHSYIQWLFPTQECSYDAYIQPIQSHEVEEIRASPEMQRRFVLAYKMMLNFYGMELVSEETGEVQASKNFKDRFRHLNRSTHNFYRITRIFIALGIFGYEHFQTPWLIFMMEHKFVHRTLPDIPFEAMHQWISAVNNDTSREHIVIQFQEFSDKWNAQGHRSKPGSRRPNAHVPLHDDSLTEKIDSLNMKDPMPTHATLESYTLEENVDNVHNTPRSQPENKETTVGIKSGKRRITVDDVKEGLDSGDNETFYQTINAILEDTEGTEYNLQLASGSDAADTIRATDDEHTKNIRYGNKAFGNTYDRRQLACGSDTAETIRTKNDEHIHDAKDHRTGNKAFGNTYDRRQLACGSDAADTIRATNDTHTPDVKDNRTGKTAYGNTYDRRQLACASDDADTTVEDTNSYAREWERDKAIDKKSLNLEFYKNEMKSKPWGCKIEEMLKWRGDYHKLESNHSYIQWLFPTQEYSNFAEEIRDSPEMQLRFVRAYKMMLDFYGMVLVSEETGEVKTSKNWKDRFRHLNRSTHNFYRITRILIALGIFGYEHFQTPWLMFMMEQKFVHRTLPDIPFGMMHHWIGSVNNDTSRELIVIQFKDFSDKWDAQGHQPRRGSRRSQALVPSQEDKLHVHEKIDNLHTAQMSEGEKLDNKVSSLREKQGKGNAIEMSEFKAGERGLHVDDVNVGLDCDDNKKIYDAGKAEHVAASEAADDSPRAVSGIYGDAKNIDRGAHSQAPADKHKPTMPNVNDDRNNSIKASGQSLSGSGATFTGNKATEPDLGVEQFGTSTRSANNSSYSASAIGGDGELVLNKQLTGTQGALSQSVRGQSDHSKRAQAQFDRSLSCPGENDGDNYPYAGQHSNDDGLAYDNLNLKFYRNQIVSKPVGRKIEEILKMEGDHVAIEENPAFFQWLFPTQQRSRSNHFAQPLQVNEAEAIRDSPELKARFLRAYKMMLDFYGMELASEETGEVQRNPRTCRERLIYLNRSPSDHPRITRILTSLGILGFAHYQLPWLRFLMRESLREGTLAAISADVLQQHWVSALSSEEDQINAVIYSTTLQDEKK